MMTRRKFFDRFGKVTAGTCAGLWLPKHLMGQDVVPNRRLDFQHKSSGVTTMPLIGVSSLGSASNTFDGALEGFQFITVTPFTIYSLGRWVISGNSGSHLLGIYLKSSTTPLATATVNTSGATSGQFAYANLSSPFSVSSSVNYVIASAETNGGDQAYNDIGMLITYNSSYINTVSEAYQNGSSFSGGGHVNGSYIPVNALITVP